MIETWVVVGGSGTPMSSEAARAALRVRIEGGRRETWLASSSGRALGLVTNTERAMVMLLDGDGDPGEHAVEPGARGSSAGFVLSNGQHDEYPNEDTVAIGEAFRIVDHIVSRGSWPPDTQRVADR